MTEDDLRRLSNALENVDLVLRGLPSPGSVNENFLYDEYKKLHDAAIEPWCVLCDILTSELNHRPADPANLPRPPRRAMATDDFLI